jgi:hypothetical protein
LTRAAVAARARLVHGRLLTQLPDLIDDAARRLGHANRDRRAKVRAAELHSKLLIHRPDCRARRQSGLSDVFDALPLGKSAARTLPFDSPVRGSGARSNIRGVFAPLFILTADEEDIRKCRAR